MNYYGIELLPCPSKYLDSKRPKTPLDDSRPAFDGLLDCIYTQRVQVYEQDLQNARRTLPNYRGNYPTHRVDLPGRSGFFIVYDDVLDRRLIEIYAWHGWAGINLVQKALIHWSSYKFMKDLYPWPAVLSFFRFARNCLTLRIREALIELDTKAAVVAAGNLGHTAKTIEDAWDGVDLKEKKADRKSDSKAVPDTPVMGEFSLGNTGLSSQLLKALTPAVEDCQEAAKNAEAIAGFKEEVSGGPPSGQVEKLAHYKQWPSRLDDACKASGIADVLPVGFLTVIVPLLKPPLQKMEMEQRLGEVLWQLREANSRVGDAFASTASWLADEIPGYQASVRVEALYDDNFSIEKQILDLTFHSASWKPRYLSLLDERLLDGLIETHAVVVDSFTYIVYGRFRLELMRRIESETKVEEVFNSIAQLAALLSLFSLVVSFVPGGATVGAPARAASTFLGMSVLAYQTYSVLHQLTKLDTKIEEQLVEADRKSADVVARVSELAAMRREYVDAVTGQLLMEFTYVIVAKAWAPLKRLLHLRGYYADLEVLLLTPPSAQK